MPGFTCAVVLSPFIGAAAFAVEGLPVGAVHVAAEARATIPKNAAEAMPTLRKCFVWDFMMVIIFD